MSRISRITLVAVFALAGCGSAPTPTQTAAPTASSQERPAPSVGETAAAAFALNRAPDDLGCDSIGWPEDIEPFSSLTFRIDPAAPDPVTAMSDTGVQLKVSWVPGFEPGPVAERVVMGPAGEVVARDGEVFALVPPGARLHGYSICLTPRELSVLANTSSG